jgi:hypothetical protein
MGPQLLPRRARIILRQVRTTDNASLERVSSLHARLRDFI